MTRLLIILASVATTVALMSTVVAQRDAPRVASVDHCFVSLIDSPDIPAEDAGKLIVLNVNEGDEVQKGALLGKLDDRLVRIQKVAAEKEREVALAQASDEIDLEYAKAQFSMASEELKESEDINARANQTVVAASKIRQLKLARQRAYLQIQKSIRDMAIAKTQADVQQAAVETADLNIERRKLIAPFDGTVVQIYRQHQEWVNAGEPVFRIARMADLCVDGYVDAKAYDAHELRDHPVKVQVKLARDRTETLEGKIVFVNPQIQTGNKLRVRADVKNRRVAGGWLLTPGASATMQIMLNSQQP